MLPRWWVWLFYLHDRFRRRLHGLLPRARARAICRRRNTEGDESAAKQIKVRGDGEVRVGHRHAQPSKDPAVLAQGQQTFSTLCAPCHRADGGGLVGPNLTDDYWIHGTNFADNVKTIIGTACRPKDGHLEGVLKPTEI